MNRHLAIDLGASSGRGIIGEINDSKLALSEVHRFSNDPVETEAGFFWDTLRLLFEIKSAILKSAHSGGVDTLGIDTWGVDYGYIDSLGALMTPSFQYRDPRTASAMKKVYEKVPYKEMYGICGIESMSFNTVFQIADDIRRRPWAVENASRLLLTPDLLGYLLSGESVSEYTIATTTSLMDAEKREFSREIMSKLGIPERLFAPVVMPGHELGRLLPKIDGETGRTGARIISVAGHDTSSAVLAVPAENEDFLFISSGTWSLMGTESAAPVINPVSLKYSFTNEGGVFGRINIMKNIMGLWLIQESRRQWKREGREYSFDEMSDAALAAEPFRCIIDPDNALFNAAGDMPERIRQFCRSTGQPEPEGIGGIVRTIFESLALRYRWTAEKLEELTGKRYSTINMIGGGTKDQLLCRFCAAGTGRKVLAGPVEATAIGNILMQAYAGGEIASIDEARRIVRNSFDIKVYEPDNTLGGNWDAAYAKFLSITGEN